jgi:hypothetical protein
MEFPDDFVLEYLLDSDAFLGIEDQHTSQQVYICRREVFEEGGRVGCGRDL